MVLFVTTTFDGKFQHTGDYFLTANGIPYLLALLVLLPALRTLQQRRLRPQLPRAAESPPRYRHPQQGFAQHRP